MKFLCQKTTIFNIDCIQAIHEIIIFYINLEEFVSQEIDEENNNENDNNNYNENSSNSSNELLNEDLNSKLNINQQNQQNQLISSKNNNQNLINNFDDEFQIANFNNLNNFRFLTKDYVSSDNTISTTTSVRNYNISTRNTYKEYVKQTKLENKTKISIIKAMSIANFVTTINYNSDYYISDSIDENFESRQVISKKQQQKLKKQEKQNLQASQELRNNSSNLFNQQKQKNTFELLEKSLNNQELIDEIQSTNYELNSSFSNNNNQRKLSLTKNNLIIENDSIINNSSSNDNNFTNSNKFSKKNKLTNYENSINSNEE